MNGHYMTFNQTLVLITIYVILYHVGLHIIEGIL